MATDKEIDVVFNWVDNELRYANYDVVSAAITKLVLHETDIDILLSWLTITLAAKSKVPNRIRIYDYLDATTDIDLKGLE